MLFRKAVNAALVGAIAATFSSTGLASSHYELEYAVTSAGGSVSTSSNYEVVDLITVEGVATPPCSSDNHYSIEPVVGGTSEPESTVADWSLY